MESQENFQQGLKEYFLVCKSRNPRLSMRGFSKKIGLPASSTSEIFNGKRNVSKSKAIEIVDRLELTPDQRVDLLKDFAPKFNQCKKKKIKPKVLSEDELDIVSDPICLAILSLIKTKKFDSGITSIATKLGRETDDVWRALLKLQLRKIVTIGANGSITRLPQPVFTSDDVPSGKIRGMHLGDMRLAATKLEEVPVHLRDFTNVTFPANPSLLPRAKEILRRTQDELCELMENDAEEVYRLCMYLFPLTVVKP
jgi:uncharacterized protein (TIGR02147 family)